VAVMKLKLRRRLASDSQSSTAPQKLSTKTTRRLCELTLTSNLAKSVVIALASSSNFSFIFDKCKQKFAVTMPHIRPEFRPSNIFPLVGEVSSS